MALRTRIHRVVMHVAIALGASVQPFTKITPNVNNTVMHKIGLDETPSRNALKEKSTISLLKSLAKKEGRPFGEKFCLLCLIKYQQLIFD